MRMQENGYLPYYDGDEFADLMKHDGGLLHAVGASNYQVMRANRTHPELSEGFGNTYNHAPMLTFWRGRFYLTFLSNPVHEHTGAGQTLLTVSENGIHWARPKVLFPKVRVKAGRYACASGDVIEVPEDKDAFMHQRMGFYHTKDDRLLASGFYGHSPHHDLCPWNQYGMGRVVCEVFDDGSFGDVYFIRYLDYSGWTPEQLPFPLYTECPDKSFVAACEELLADRLVTQQWREEHGYRDESIGFPLFEKDPNGDNPSNTPFEKASSFCFYHLNEDSVVGLWKQGNVGRSDDGGKSWCIQYEPSFVTSGAKSWGQKTADGRYAIAYVNSLSSEHRYPLAVVTSDDGIRFSDLACVFGELPPRRYDGVYKDFGPQYIRGICEGHNEYPKDALWLCHSINKEDIGVTRVPLPIKRHVECHVQDTFAESVGGAIKDWNIYSTVWSPISAVNLHGDTPCMRIADKDPCDYARAMRIFPSSEAVSVSLDFMSVNQYEAQLEIEITDKTGIPACRVMIGGGQVLVRYGSESECAFEIPPHAQWHTLRFEIDCPNNVYSVSLNGEVYDFGGAKRFINKINAVERLIIRTKPWRYLPNYEIYPTTPDIGDVDDAADERIYYIANVKTEDLK